MLVNDKNFLIQMFTLPAGSLPTKENVMKAVAFNEARASIYKNLYYYYRGYQDIFDRKKKDGLQNEKLMINHAEYIVDINTGYLLGDAVEYQVNNSQEGVEYDIEPILDSYKKQPIWMVDHALALQNGIYGKNYEYIFAKEGTNDLTSVALAPYNCIIAYDNTMEHKKLFAVIYSLTGTYPSAVDAAANFNGFDNVTVITADKITSFASAGALAEGASVDHKFGVVPVIEYKNNFFSRGDFFSVISLMDALNILQSDRMNDKIQLVEAALIIKGAMITAEQIAGFKESRTLSLPDGSDISYLIKQLQETEVEVLKKSIADDIHKISKTPNLSDKEFVGNSSGVAIKYKLVAFEQSIKNKEAYFEKSLLERFTIYNGYLHTLSNNTTLIPIEEVDVVFRKSLPQNDLETSQMINNLRGIVSDKTLLPELSFVSDASDEIDAVEQQKMDSMNMELQQFGTEQPIDSNANSGLIQMKKPAVVQQEMQMSK